MLNRDRLQSILDGFPKLTIALVGDLFLDRYLEVQPGAHELSIETGLEAYQITRVRNSPGALGTVMNNLAALGLGQLQPVTVIGDDGHGYDLLRSLQHLPLDEQHVLQDVQRLTPTYMKPLEQNESGSWRELNRLDVRTREPLAESTTAQLCEHLRTAFEACDGLIVLDQIPEPDWGVLNDPVRRSLEQLSAENPEKLVLTDSRARLSQFTCGVLKGNRSELHAAGGVAAGTDEALHEAAYRLAQRNGHPVYLTLGADGILVAQPNGHVAVSPALAVQGEIDIVGAGDSATSGIVASLLSGADYLEAAEVGNLVASITVQQLGTTGTASPAQLMSRVPA